ncbi:hypothetical protein CC1G_12584 [Coprinopsis cinerea okayama7|uniref:Uncharacterized protein n=1 Tax=Coprinopsis cinerea (strain Okayama-7 / 130 / ATCC MYA-4618 / FGSC 9003) TaxID=240176 RepID=A8P6U7_COPC7|nr:hypothetical protein CC1G_12584 [Coprinopsis cinerea okayama7\|eukprot:XP_001839231.2 hypothetical protein CC1G_12584 [Coprinopsis cinerea okayama7\
MSKTDWLLAKKTAREERGMIGTGDDNDDRYLAIRGYGVGKAEEIEENRDVERAVVVAGDLFKPYDYHYDVLEVLKFLMPTLACLLEDRDAADGIVNLSPKKVIFWARTERILDLYLTEQLVGPKTSYEDRMVYYKTFLEEGARNMIIGRAILKSHRKRSMEEDTEYIVHYRHKIITLLMQSGGWLSAGKRYAFASIGIPTRLLSGAAVFK